MNFLFDLYGTLIDIWTDEESVEFWQGVAATLGEDTVGYLALQNEYKSLCEGEKGGELVEFDLLRVFEKMLLKRGKSPEGAPEFARKFRALSMKRLQEFPHVKEILVGLRARGAGVYLLSNAQSCFTRDELRTTELAPLFDGIIISSEVGYKKPSREIFDIACARFDISASDCVYVGNDLRDDVLGAKSSGMYTVYIPTEQSGCYMPCEVGEPDLVAKNHTALKRILFDITKKGYIKKT